jgi:hypothetical protein
MREKVPIEIRYGPKRRWPLRAAWTARKLSTTFQDRIGEWTFVGFLAFSALGCASLGIPTPGDEDEKLARANESAREQLAFGMSKEKATAIMSEAEVRPPWANDLGIGPQVVRNPFDTLRFESPAGEEYEVLRYAVGLYGEPSCPFVHGDAVLVPLIFFEEKLVGWRWSYLESVLQRRLREDEQAWGFGRFCGRASDGPGE